MTSSPDAPTASTPGLAQEVLVRRFHRVYVNHGDQTVRLELTASAEELAVSSPEHVYAELNGAERIARTWSSLGYTRQG